MSVRRPIQTPPTPNNAFLNAPALIRQRGSEFRRCPVMLFRNPEGSGSVKTFHRSLWITRLLPHDSEVEMNQGIVRRKLSRLLKFLESDVIIILL